MFLYGLLVALLIFVCFLLIIVILIQQGKGGIGLGSSFGAAQMLFGGSGGQDIFQKITWTLGAIFMLGSLGLFLMGAKSTDYASYLTKNNLAKKQAQMPVAPMGDTSKQIPVSNTGDVAKTDMAKQVQAPAQVPVAPVQMPDTPVKS